MPRLNPSQWLTLRAAWSASPLPGFAWLTQAGGGPWPVSREAIRSRALKESWQKVQVSPATVARAHLAADRAMAEQGELGGFACTGNPASQAPSAGAAFDPDFGFPDEPDGTEGADGRGLPGEQAAADQQDGGALREWLLDVHRKEWKAARRLVHAAMRQADLARGLEKARLAKIAVEALRAIQAAERTSYGLDVELLDFQNMTDEQLQSVADGRTPR